MEPKDSGIPTLEKKVAERSKYQKDEGYGRYYNDVADWNIGDSVPFKLIASIPNNIESYDEYKFVFHDTLSNAFTLEEDSIKVFVGATTAANVEQFTPQDADLYQVDFDGQSFTLTIPDINLLDAHGNLVNYVIITYSATLNQNADIDLNGNENTAYLEFSNDPNGDGLGRTAEDTVIVFTYELDGTKVDGETQAALTDDFAQYPVSLEDLDSSGLRSLAQTLDAYVARDTLTPLLSQKTGEDGMVSFEGLSPGLYLVLGESYTQDNTVYTPSPMLFYLPGQGEDGGWEYEVTASCKFDREEITDTTVSRKVQKVWKDSGNQSKRPEMVFVQLLENGAVVDTVALSEENNWEYTWENLDASSRWQVAETSVPDGYTVTVTQEGTLFVVTNTYPGKTPPKLPQTGLLWWPVPLLACAGLALVIAGAVARRRGRGSHEK